jgi:hypothetical protein
MDNQEMTPEQYGVQNLIQAMLQAGVSQEDAEKAAPDLVAKAEKNS